MYQKNICLFLPNSIEYAIGYFAISFANRTIVPVNIKSKAREIMSFLEKYEIDNLKK